MFFPWPGAPLFSGTGLWPGKRASASGESSLAWLQPLTSSHRITRSCPQGCDLFSALRLESHPSGGFPVCPIAVSRSGKKYSFLCALRVSVVSKSIYPTLVSTVCGAKGIDYSCRAAICRCSLRFLGPSNSQKNILCQVPRTKRAPDTSTVSADPTRLVLT